mgnify:CR=1 FL=1
MNKQGFTLLELLVVIVVLSIATGLIVVRGTPGNNNYLQAEAQKLTQILRIAQQHSILKSQEIRFIPVPKGYTFEALSGTRWLPVEGESMLRTRLWDNAGVQVNMSMDGQAVSFVTIEPTAGLNIKTLTLGLGKSRINLSSGTGGIFKAGKPFEATNDMPANTDLYKPQNP